MNERGEKGGGRATRVVVVGAADQGIAAARAVCGREDLELVAVIDNSQAGRKLRSISGAEGLPELEILSHSPGRLRAVGGEVALITGRWSGLEECFPLLQTAAREGLHVVATCHELCHPFFSQPELAERLDGVFSRSGRTCLGTGLHPGFLLDRLPVFVAGVSGEIRHAGALLKRDLGRCAAEVREMCGLGTSLKEFEARPEEEGMGPPGLLESALLLCEGLGMEPGEVDLHVDPLVAEEEVHAGPVKVQAGHLAGIRQEAQVFSDGREVVRLEHVLVAGELEPGAEIRLDASPPIVLSLRGQLDERLATAWALANAAGQVVLAEPGLMTVLDLPVSRVAPQGD